MTPIVITGPIGTREPGAANPDMPPDQGGASPDRTIGSLQPTKVSIRRIRHRSPEVSTSNRLQGTEVGSTTPTISFN